MSIFLSADRKSYRRWANILISLLIPGAGHFLSGQKRAGIIWLCSYVLLLIALIWFTFFPHAVSLLNSVRQYFAVAMLFHAVILVDSCRRRIPKSGYKVWLVFFAVLLIYWAAILVSCFFLVKFMKQSVSPPVMEMYAIVSGVSRDGKGKGIGIQNPSLSTSATSQPVISKPEDLIPLKPEDVKDKEQKKDVNYGMIVAFAAALLMLVWMLSEPRHKEQP